MECKFYYHLTQGNKKHRYLSLQRYVLYMMSGNLYPVFMVNMLFHWDICF
jgi:hypothetical protein